MIYKCKKTQVIEWPGNRIELKKGDYVASEAILITPLKDDWLALPTPRILLSDAGLKLAKKKGLVSPIDADSKLPA